MTRWERACRWLAWMLPRDVVYHAGVRLWVDASTGVWSWTNATSVTCDEALRRWEVNA